MVDRYYDCGNALFVPCDPKRRSCPQEKRLGSTHILRMSAFARISVKADIFFFGTDGLKLPTYNSNSIIVL